MARQEGPIKLTGRLGDLCFYKCGEDYLVRQKGGPTRKQLKESPKFVRVRENNAEFGNCSMAAKLLRQTVRCYMRTRDSLMYRRLTKIMTQVKNNDLVAPRGKRT